MKNPIDTCKTFRGTSCRCTKDLHCLCIGIRPRGLGLLLKSRQLQPELALAGERWPFVSGRFPFSAAAIASFFGVKGVIDGLADVSPAIRLFLSGLLLRDLALRSTLESVSSSISSSMGAGDDDAFFFADLVTGPKYPSFDDSLDSDGVGEGEITRGVAGTLFEDAKDMLKSGREGTCVVPVRARARFVTRASQLKEW